MNTKQKLSPMSVVIPAFNEQNILNDCLMCLKSQLSPADEIIVVDNNSTDRTIQIAKAHGVKVISEPRQGQKFAQAKGFEAAKNDIIVRIDADTLVYPSWAKKIRAHFKDLSVDAVSGPGLAYDVKFQFLNIPLMTFLTFTTNKLISGSNVVWGSNFAMRRSAWNATKDKLSSRSDVWEDFELGLAFAESDQNVRIDKTMVVGFSSRNVMNASTYKAMKYQFGATRTYWALGLRLKASLSLIERLLVLSIGAPFYILEPVLSARAKIYEKQLQTFGPGLVRQ